MENFMMSAKECLKNARIALCMNKKEFAEFLNLSSSMYCQIEKGNRSPSYTKIREIVEKLNAKGIEVGYKDLQDEKKQ